MPQNRYFFDGPLTLGAELILADDEFHYLRNVMRTECGEVVEVIDGKGTLAEAEVTKMLKKEAHLVVKHATFQEKSPFTFTLALAFLKPSHLEYAVEKCCEVGVENFILFPAARSEKKAISDQYLKRLKSIILSSTKQCGRLYMPSLTIEKRFPTLSGEIFFGDLESKVALSDITEESISLVIGPEAGFTEEERQALIKQKAKGIRLHTNTLRAETAAVIGSYSFVSHSTN